MSRRNILVHLEQPNGAVIKLNLGEMRLSEGFLLSRNDLIEVARQILTMAKDAPDA